LTRSKDGTKAEWDKERTLATLGKRKRRIQEEGRMVERRNGEDKMRNRERWVEK